MSLIYLPERWASALDLLKKIQSDARKQRELDPEASPGIVPVLVEMQNGSFGVAVHLTSDGARRFAKMVELTRKTFADSNEANWMHWKDSSGLVKSVGRAVPSSIRVDGDGLDWAIEPIPIETFSRGDFIAQI